jgi:glycosyltransferase involved in cell wall biosynthesis
VLKSKKVAIIYSGGRNRGGVESYLVNLLKNYQGAEVKFFVISLGSWTVLEEIKVDKHILARSPLNILNFWKIKKLLKEEEIDLLVSHGMVSHFYSRVCSILTRVPHLATIHSDFRSDYPNKYKLLFFMLAEKTLGRVTSKYIAVSNYLKNQLIDSGIDGGKVEVVYNGVDFESIGLPKSRVDKGGHLVVGTVGRLHKVKGFDLLIKAISKVDDKKAILNIWGSGEEYDNLHNLICSLGLEKKVFLRGEEAFGKIINEIDIYIQPSLSEGFGLAVVQAMGCGLPVIVTPAGSLPEIVEDGKTGIIAEGFTPDDIASSINKLVANKELRKELSKNAQKEAVGRFGADLWVKKTIDCYIGAAK